MTWQRRTRAYTDDELRAMGSQRALTFDERVRLQQIKEAEAAERELMKRRRRDAEWQKKYRERVAARRKGQQ